MENVTVFDLETIPDESKIDIFPLKLNTRLVDPQKIAEDKTKKEATRDKDMGLDPNFGKICCCSFRDKDKTSTLLSESESELIMEIWNVLANYQQFVTFDGNRFDVPFLIKRSWLLDIYPTVKIDNKKYYTGNHLDLRVILNNWNDYATGTLDFYCQLKLGRGKAGGMDGSMVYPLWQERKLEKIKEYSTDEIELLWELFLSMKGFYY